MLRRASRSPACCIRGGSPCPAVPRILALLSGPGPWRAPSSLPSGFNKLLTVSAFAGSLAAKVLPSSRERGRGVR